MEAVKIDRDLYSIVQQKLKYESDIDTTGIAIKVKNGIVILAGTVKSHTEKKLVENAVKSLSDVKALANELQVTPSSIFQCTDAEIARAAAGALKWSTLAHKDRVKVAVDDGHLTLTGEMEWNFQRNAVEMEVRDLFGVKSVINNIIVKPGASPIQVKQHIEEEFKRNAILHMHNINVQVNGRKVTLAGTVHSLAEYEEAARLAWKVAGVTDVDNQLVIKYD